jgi:hypothetical protein
MLLALILEVTLEARIQEAVISAVETLEVTGMMGGTLVTSVAVEAQIALERYSCLEVGVPSTKIVSEDERKMVCEF